MSYKRLLIASSRPSGLSRISHCFLFQRNESTVSIKSEEDRRSPGSASKGPSHLYHPGSTPILEQTIGDLLKQAAYKWPDRECIVSLHQNVRLTFSEVLKRADKLAAGLKKLGLNQGDRIGLWGPNDVEWFLTFMATARAGLILVAINPAYRRDELVYALTTTNVKVLVCPESYRSQDYAQMVLQVKDRCPALEHCIVYSENRVAGTRHFSDIETLAGKAEVQAIAEQQGEISPYEGCNIQFTSGTTGKPKAALISHRSFVNNSRQCSERNELTGKHDKICLNVPFFHVFGLVMAEILCLHAGTTIVLEGPTFNPKNSLHAVAKEKCTVMYGTPTMWINIVDAQSRIGAPVESLSRGATGGSPASPELFKRIREFLKIDNMKSLYGLTETTAAIFQSMPGDSRELQETTVGHLSDHVEAMCFPVPFGTAGELWTRGYTNMMKYWEDQENTAKTITKDGWVKTGDLFILHENGYGQIVGRLKDIVIRGGENIFPKEVEDFLESHPAVLEVHAFGVHDDVYGEELCACVRLQKGANITAEELKSYALGKIARFKIPKYIVFVNEFPRTTSGKIQKFKLKDDMEKQGAVPTAPQK
ncbi:acyl-CoA synthetase family member 2, mitochondrial isoform X2 [Orussus abietinus]|uniref:acyl-CoA synthetase family member 2, mitochondrial isoform X2 n=1 Tax=Orussus abietinus TaxID=222816 RepID=UPI00062661EB|nr:acyl-CoA synthetase family member 2, mitochondrial isoform X2 [Orussus abietinus]